MKSIGQKFSFLSFSVLWMAIRPKTLIASLSPVLIGGKWAAMQGFFSPFLFGCTLISALGIQIITNLINDLYDFLKGADTSQRKGPPRVLQKGLMKKRQMEWFIYLMAVITFLASIPLIMKGGILIGSLFALALLLAWGYTAGPFPLAYQGLGEPVVFIFFGPVATAMTAYLQIAPFFPIKEAASFLFPESFLLGIGPGALSSAILILNNLRDHAEDDKANKRTLIVRLYRRFSSSISTYIGKSILALTLFLPIITTFSLPHPFWVYLSYPLPALFIIYRLYFVTSAEEYLPLFSQTIRLHLLYTLAFFIAL